MTIAITKSEKNGVNLVSVSGRIVFGEEANVLRREVRPLLSSSNSAVVVNLQDIDYVDSGGVGALVSLYTTARAIGAEIKFCNAKPKVAHVLTITKLFDILGIYPSEEQALSSIRRNARA